MGTSLFPLLGRERACERNGPVDGLVPTEGCSHIWITSPSAVTTSRITTTTSEIFSKRPKLYKCVFGTTQLAILGKSTTRTTLPAWLTSPGPVLLRKHARSNKYSPLVERVHLLHANPQYAYVVLPDGREDMVSVRDLAPAGAPDPYPEHSTVTVNPVPTRVYTHETPRTPSPTQTPHDTPIPGTTHMHEGLPTPNVLAPQVRPEPAQPLLLVQSPPVLRRLQRWTRPHDRLDL
ncbi:uncharacterized protein LOC132392366 [Hypanus sabinus]|uniref:uncharacterized protein LOC132392366 n=1 Tax=Hypanus sabinus TaxID=79690 RepID=UPI0028C37BD8|nr:uncharacterized protein LOC132392366 [Hypanus sabinus]